MPAIEREKLPDGAAKLLDALIELNAQGDRWVQRSEIADAIGKKRLTAGDMAFLEMLEATDFVESTHQDTHTPMGYKWVYRLAEGG